MLDMASRFLKEIFEGKKRRSVMVSVMVSSAFSSTPGLIDYVPCVLHAQTFGVRAARPLFSAPL
jgi:hypothetical protein